MGMTILIQIRCSLKLMQFQLWVPSRPKPYPYTKNWLDQTYKTEKYHWDGNIKNMILISKLTS